MNAPMTARQDLSQRNLSVLRWSYLPLEQGALAHPLEGAAADEEGREKQRFRPNGVDR
jgi:hypothetical protein